MSARLPSERALHWLLKHRRYLSAVVASAVQRDEVAHRAHKAATEMALLGHILDRRGLNILSARVVRRYVAWTLDTPTNIRAFGPSIILMRRAGPDTLRWRLVDRYLAAACRAANEPSLMRVMDVGFTARLAEGGVIAPSELAQAIRFLTQSVSFSTASNDFLYSFTHVCFYAADFGLRPLQASPRQRRQIWANIAGLAAQVIQIGDLDLLAELIVCGRIVDPGRADIQHWCDHLAANQQRDGSFNRDRNPGTGPRGSAFFRRYHPTLVALWALDDAFWRRASTPAAPAATGEAADVLSDIADRLNDTATSGLERRQLDLVRAFRRPSGRTLGALIDRAAADALPHRLLAMDAAACFRIDIRRLSHRAILAQTAAQLADHPDSPPVLRQITRRLLPRQGRRRTTAAARRADLWTALIGGKADDIKRALMAMDGAPDARTRAAVECRAVAILLRLESRLARPMRSGHNGLIAVLYVAATILALVDADRNGQIAIGRTDPDRATPIASAVSVVEDAPQLA